MLFCFGMLEIRSSSDMSTAQDLLHVLHQGVACVVIPALLCAHLEEKHPHIKLKELDRLISKDLYGHYKKWCSERSPYASACSQRFSALRFGKEKWSMCPELSSVFKAAVVKCMMFWCSDFLKAEMDATPGGRMRAFCMHCFAKFQLLLDMAGPWLTDSQSQEVVKHGWGGLLFYQQLASQDRLRTDGRRTYKIIPKFHSFLELQLYIKETSRNPKLFGRN